MRPRKPGEVIETVVLHRPDAREKLLFCFLVLSLAVASTGALMGVALGIAGDWAFAVLLASAAGTWICAGRVILRRMSAGWLRPAGLELRQRLPRRVGPAGKTGALTVELATDAARVRFGSRERCFAAGQHARFGDGVGFVPIGRYRDEVIYRLFWSAQGPMQFTHVAVGGAETLSGSVCHRGLVYSPCTAAEFFDQLTR